MRGGAGLKEKKLFAVGRGKNRAHRSSPTIIVGGCGQVTFGKIVKEAGRRNQVRFPPQGHPPKKSESAPAQAAANTESNFLEKDNSARRGKEEGPMPSMSNRKSGEDTEKSCGRQ